MTRSAARISTGVVGLGGWGKKLVRNFYFSPGAEITWLCDLDAGKAKSLQRQFPARRTTQRFADLQEDDELEAIVIATTGPTHYELCKGALLAGKDVYVEKPFVLSVDEAEELIELAEKRNRILMVGHLLEYHPVVTKLKQLIAAGELGDIRYIYSQRLNLCAAREGENAMWDFAPHDVSVILYLLGRLPTDVSARGQCFRQPGVHDVAFITLGFGTEAMANVHVSWLDPNKTRRLTIVGTRKMAVFDDVAATEKLKIYDNGVRPHLNNYGFDGYAGVRFGDISAPFVSSAEPLRLECDHFLECVRDRRQPLTDGQDGLRVVKVLAAAERSLMRKGEPVRLEDMVAAPVPARRRRRSLI